MQVFRFCSVFLTCVFALLLWWVVGYQTGVPPPDAGEQILPVHMAPVASMPPHLRGEPGASSVSRQVSTEFGW